MKEESVELILWDWLKIKSQFVEEIYFNRKNILGCKVFTTKGINKKPDFIIKINRGYGSEYIAVEIKNSESDRNILDGGKILDLYYENYVLDLTRYFIEDKQIEIKHFAVASENSPKGFLFRDEKDIWDNSTLKNDGWRVTNAKLKLEPLKEYKDTSRFVRELWAKFRRVREKYDGKSLPSLGILMTNFGDNDFSPWFMTMININWIQGRKNKWGARWWKI